MRLDRLQRGFAAPLLVVFAVILLISIFVVQSAVKKSQNTNARASITGTKKVSAYYVYWDKARGFASIQNNSDILSSVSPFAYTLDARGNVLFDPDGGSSVVDSTSVSFMRQKNIKVIPTIHNLINGTWNNGNVVSTVINNPTLMQQHITNIVTIVETNGYDGIDIDYENLNGSADRLAYTNFMTALASALHAKGKVVTTAVYGKTNEPGGWNGPQAQDLAALGRVVDEVRFMLYDYDPARVGPLAPYNWTDGVLAFAKTQMAPEKVMQGIGLYVYDYVGNSYPAEYTHVEAMQKVQQYNATVNWSTTEFAPWFSYVANGTNHTAWFENAQSVGYKVDLTNKYGVGGVFFWRLGGEDPGVWNMLRTKLVLTSPSASAQSSPTPQATSSLVPTATPIVTSTPQPPVSTGTPVPLVDLQPPSVVITNPVAGVRVSTKTTQIQAQVSDNGSIRIVEFYIDNTLIQSDTSAPYAVYANTRRLSSGSHTIKVVAKDAANNSGQATITVSK